MTDIATTYHPELEESREILVGAQQASSGTQTSCAAHALITEQQVLFNTAAAVALPSAKPRGWNAVVSAVGSWFAKAAQPPKPVYPKRRAWLETAILSREMDRL
jgi:hypothetical protein